jgi:3-oxoacyl-[acyl-carrier-protein] synthase II
MVERRVVVTGMGSVNPMGCDVESSWKNLIESKSGIRKITQFEIPEDVENISRVAGEIVEGDGEGELILENFVEKKDQRKMGRFIQLAIVAADEAVKNAGLSDETEEQKERIGVIIGSGIGGLEIIQNSCQDYFEKGIKKISPFFIPASLINLSGGHVSIIHGFKGPNHAPVTACASGTHAISDSARIIKDGDADIMVCGGAESAICGMGIGGFNAMHALSTKRNDEPTKASRPWDTDRDGFVMGEGCGLLVIEELEHAKKRGAKIYCEIAGYGSSGDAYHMSAPEMTGAGAKRSMKMALNNAGMTAKDVGYVNAHGTSTPLGDAIEFNAVKEVFADNLDNLCMSSTKSATGHMLGAAGAVEAVFCIKALMDGIIPPTLNLDNQDENCTGIDLVPYKAKKKEINACLSNSFGFGGTNGSIIFKKYKA